MEVSGQLYAQPLYSKEKYPSAQWITNWVGPRFSMDDVEKGKFFTLPGNEL
jgi:hypothetical protein